MRVTGTAQHQALRRNEIPPVEQVTGGVWSVPVPIPDSPLRYTLSYLIEHSAGFILVDPGWSDPVSWESLLAGIHAAGAALSALTGVVVTHVHPDHHGLSGQVREASGASIAMHEREDGWLASLGGELSWRHDRLAWYLRWCGAPPAQLEELRSGRPGWTHGRMVRADRVLRDGDLVDAPGITLRAIWTPGHSPGHLCYHDETHDLLLTGDHVLPWITPNVSMHDLDSSPLDDYLASLAGLRGLSASEILPAHEYRFADLDSRLEAIAAHHRTRAEEICGLLREARDGGLTAWQAASAVSWSRNWASLGADQRQAALGEVLAHLRHLQRRGLAERVDRGETGHWSWTGGNGR